jgi:glycosyltransferase involved in cell wall biosynthesis
MALTLLEAMACGTAIVATRVPGTSALGGAGQLIPVEDPESLAEAVDTLLADPQRRRLLRAAARERAVKHYSLQRSLRGILELWQGLGARPGTDSQNTESLPDDTLVEKKTN